MNDKRKALGRGLDSLLPSARPAATAAVAAGEAVREIPLDDIERNPYQTRSRVDEAALEELAASIRSTGVVQPILLRKMASGKLQLIAGERRWMASRRAGKKTVPAIVREVSNEQAMEMTIIENLQREDLNAIEQARAYQRLGSEFGLTQEQMASRTGKDRATVANFLRLLKMPEQIQYDVEQGALSFGHAKALMMLTDAELIVKCARRMEEKQMSVRQAEELIRALLVPEERIRKAQPAVDPNVRAAQRELESALGVKVTIKDRGGKGSITLEYASLEDFDRVVEVLSGKP